MVRLSAFTIPLAFGGLLSACSQPVGIEVQLLNPCNQDALREVDYLRFEPRGEAVDSAGLTVFQPVKEPTMSAIPVPLDARFQLVVTGHRGEVTAPPAAIGISNRIDLSTSEDTVTVQIPVALVDSFYKTTDLSAPTTCSQMENPRFGATATWLPDARRALIVGGLTLGTGPAYRRAIESYDPATGTFTEVGELNVDAGRAFHTATYIGKGKVLITGGQAEIGNHAEALRSALVLDASDPDHVRTAQVLSMRKDRTGHTATLLADGRVVIVGGRRLLATAGRPEDHEYLSTLEIFDPEKNIFSLPPDAAGTGTVQLSAGRFGHSATALKSSETNNDILIAGGFNQTSPEPTLEVIQISKDSVTVVKPEGAQMGAGAIFHTAVAGEDGRILISGGYASIADADPDGFSPINPSNAVEIWSYDATTQKITLGCTDTLTRARGHHTATFIGQRALFAGGQGADASPTATAEIATVAAPTSGAPASTRCFTATPKTVMLADARARHTATPFDSGEVLLLGGLQGASLGVDGVSIASSEVFAAARDLSP